MNWKATAVYLFELELGRMDRQGTEKQAELIHLTTNRNQSFKFCFKMLKIFI